MECTLFNRPGAALNKIKPTAVYVTVVLRKVATIAANQQIAK
jgi:hypothetical protein